MTRRRLSRRELITAAGAAGASIYALGDPGVAAALRQETVQSHKDQAIVAWNEGGHQAGVVTPRQRHLAMAAFDVTASDRAALIALLRLWQHAVERLTVGESVLPGAGVTEPFPTAAELRRPPADTGEALDHSPARLTITIGFGPSLFDGRFGLEARRPAQLVELPVFAGDELQAKRSGGDLSVQACADDQLVAHHAIRDLARIGSDSSTLRWLQTGFVEPSQRKPHDNPRSLLGYKDGTANLKASDESRMRSNVWASASDGARWMEGGTYQVFRRILVKLDVWDSSSLAKQQNTFGRYKTTGAPYGGTSEFDPVTSQLLPPNSHVRLANPRKGRASERERILRRSFNFDDGYEPEEGRMEAGLAFIAYQRDPRRQFVPIQQRLSEADELNLYTVHTASATFAVPPAPRRRGFVGERLLRS